MNESRAAIRYAKAALELAVEKKAEAAVETDMRSIVSTLADSRELRLLLASPVVKDADKKAVLAQVFTGSNAITEGLLDTLLGNKRIAQLGNVAQGYIRLNEKRQGVEVAQVTTAVPLTADLEKKILAQVAKITSNKVTLENTVDHNIIGGFVLRMGDLQYDASISGKLNRLKREFTNSL